MLEQVKVALYLIITLAVVTLFGYWAVISLQSGSEFKLSQQVKELTEENKDLAQKVENLTNELNILKPVVEEKKENPIVEMPKESPATIIVYKHQSLINELQKFIDDNTAMKLKSSGKRVGTIQNFLNIYNNTSNKIDNDYGVGTQKLVAVFQKDQGLNADGEVGPGTFEKMIDWLKEQN